MTAGLDLASKLITAECQQALRELEGKESAHLSMPNDRTLAERHIAKGVHEGMLRAHAIIEAIRNDNPLSLDGRGL